MGFFSFNEHSNLASNFEFPVLEGYSDGSAAGLAIVEGYQNDLALFTAAVETDLQEMAALREGGDIVALQEASIAGAWQAIKEFFKKLGAKIKAIFAAFMAKIESYLTRDVKSYVKKYENYIKGKTFKDMKCKFAKPKKATFGQWNAVFKFPDFNDEGSNGTLSKDKYIKNLYGEVFGSGKSRNDDKDYELPDRSDVIEGWYSNFAENSVTSASDYDTWLHEELFEDEENDDEWDLGRVMECRHRLEESSKMLSDVQSSNKKALKAISDSIKEIDKYERDTMKLYKDSTDGKADADLGFKAHINVKNNTGNNVTYTRYRYANNVHNYSGTGYKNHAPNDPNTVQDYTENIKLSNLQKIISLLRQNASCYQEVAIHVTNQFIKEIKFSIAQDKRVYAKAVGYKAIKGTNESILLDAIGDVAFDEVYDYFEAPGIG